MRTIELNYGYRAIVDDDLYETLSQYGWKIARCDSGLIYARTSRVLMHRMIMCAGKGQEVDHIDGDGLNNQRSNLRFCTRSQNIRNARMKSNNTSGFTGVFKQKDSRGNRTKLWYAKIMTDEGRKFLGYFSTPEEASEKYQEVAKSSFGEFYRPA